MDIPSKLISLWQRCFDDEPKFIRAFYNSFDSDGNVVIAHVKNGELRITRGIHDAADIVGVVNRVPVQLHLGEDVINGFYLYGCCVDEHWRGKGVFKRMLDNADCDADFTVLIPETPELFPMYEGMGYARCKELPFPFEADASVLEPLALTPADGDLAPLYAIESGRQGDGFTFGGSFTHFIIQSLPEGSIHYIFDGDTAVGYVIFEKICDKSIKIYDMYCPSDEYSAIITLKKLADGYARPKSLIRSRIVTSDNVPALNRCGEY